MEFSGLILKWFIFAHCSVSPWEITFHTVGILWVKKEGFVSLLTQTLLEADLTLLLWLTGTQESARGDGLPPWNGSLLQVGLSTSVITWGMRASHWGSALAFMRPSFHHESNSHLPKHTCTKLAWKLWQGLLCLHSFDDPLSSFISNIFKTPKDLTWDSWKGQGGRREGSWIFWVGRCFS